MIDLKINNIMKVKIEAPLTKRLDKMLEKAIEWTRDLMIYHEGIIFLHEKGDDPNLLYNMPSVFCRIKQGKVVQYTIIGLLEHNEELYLLPWMKDGSKSKIPAGTGISVYKDISVSLG